MNREREQDELIELGAVSTETKGMTFGVDDSQAGLYVRTGLSED